MPWFVLYTKARNEKKVAEKLIQMGIETFCPTVSKIMQWSDRQKEVQVPLIPSYVFVNIAEKERPVVFEVNGVVRYLYWLNKPATVSDEEIRVLKVALEGTFNELTVKPSQVGSKIKIPSGLFKGKEGIVKYSSAQKIELVLTELGYTIVFSRALLKD
jgi:transcription antitermination factor NusG